MAKRGRSDFSSNNMACRAELYKITRFGGERGGGAGERVDFRNMV